MQIAIRYFDGCPNWRTADGRLREALAASGVAADIVFEAIETSEDADRMAFHGSPTFLFDGVDPFPADESGFGLTCRVYRTEAGLEGSPSVTQLLAALS